MDLFQDKRSSLLSDDDVLNSNCSTLHSRIKWSRHEIYNLPTEVHVLDNEVNTSLSRQDDPKLSLPFVSAICSKYFIRKDNLKQHIVIHSWEICDVCHKAFYRKTHLYLHKLSHLKVPTQHRWDLCNEVFSRKCDSLKHRKIHKSHKQHICAQCNEVFHRKSDLFHHVRTFQNATTKQSEHTL